MPAYESLERIEAREAAEKFKAGQLDLFNYIRQQLPGTKVTHEGQTYLSSMDGPHVLRSLPLGSLIAHAGDQEYRNPAITRKYAQQLKDDPGSVEPIQVQPHTTYDTFTVKDGHHRWDGAKMAGLDRVAAWVPLETHMNMPLGSHPIKKTVNVRPGEIAPVHPELHRIAESYVQKHNIAPKLDPIPYNVVNEKQAASVAQQYHNAKHTPNDPNVQAAYGAFKKETRDQFNHLRANGFNFIPTGEAKEEGVGTDKANQVIDTIRAKKPLEVYLGGDLPQDHPLAEPTDYVTGNHRWNHNEMFRAVHDVFGHAVSGNRFGPTGEEHAFQHHARMYSPLARQAMQTETKGQNSWLHYGPNRLTPPADRPYAEQKATLLKLAAKARQRLGDAAEPEGRAARRVDLSFDPAQLEQASQHEAAGIPAHVMDRMMPHEREAIGRSKSHQKHIGKLTDEAFHQQVASTLAGRHGRHWYDENHEILHAMNDHSSDPMDFFTDAGLEAATSPNAGILPNHQAKEDIKRLFHLGPVVKGRRINPKSRDPEDVRTLLESYRVGDRMLYPPDYRDPKLRGTPIVMRSKTEKDSDGNPRKLIHYGDEGWQHIPLVYPLHTHLAAKVLSDPEKFTNAHTHGNLTRHPVKADSFLRNKLGNQDPVTVDRHEARGWGLSNEDIVKLSPGTYHMLAAAGRHVTNLLGSAEHNMHALHPVYGSGWTPARGQAARWMTMRGLADLINHGHTAESAVQNLSAGDIYKLSSFVEMYKHPSLRSRLTQMIREGIVSPRIEESLRKIEAKYAPNPEELTQKVGTSALLPLARMVASNALKRGPAPVTQPSPEVHPLFDQPVRKQLFARFKERLKKSVAFGAASPNVDELSFDEALHRLQGDGHGAFRQAANDMMQRMGMEGSVHDALGDWSDGAENSLAHFFHSPIDHKKLDYLLAWLGKLGRQKAILKFVPGAGPHQLYQAMVPDTDLGKVRKRLDQAGVPFRTLMPKPEGTHVLVADLDGNLGVPFKNFARGYNANVQTTRGQGEFVGGTSREDASQKFSSIIHNYESEHGIGPEQAGNGDASSGASGPNKSPSGGAIVRGQFHTGGTFLPS